MTPFVTALFMSSAVVAVTTWNPSDKDSSITLSNGNRTASVTSPGGSYHAVRGIGGKSTGKWYFEILVNTVGSSPAEEFIGLATASASLTNYLGQNTSSVGYSGSGDVYSKMTGIVATYASYTAGDVIQVAWDGATGNIWFGKNGTFNGSPAAGTGAVSTLGGTVYPACNFYTTTASKTITATNTYTIPSGFQLWS